MQFNSIEFIFEFLSLFLLIYYLIRREFRALVLTAGVLVYFKLYAGGRYLPAGMSSYMFQAAAILVDVYTGNVKAGMGFPECLLEDASNPESKLRKGEMRCISSFY